MSLYLQIKNLTQQLPAQLPYFFKLHFIPNIGNTYTFMTDRKYFNDNKHFNRNKPPRVSQIIVVFYCMKSLNVKFRNTAITEFMV